MKEFKDFDNVVPVCTKTQQKIKEKTQQSLIFTLRKLCKNKQTFYVKSRFLDTNGAEHMWVKISPNKVFWNTSTLVGTLDNEPFIVDRSLGDLIKLKFEDISQIIS